jgi:hypothetical protein
MDAAVRIVYLDQNKWIDLARAVKYPAENPEVRAILELLCQEAQAGRVLLPLTATNIYETHKIGDPERRFDLAYTQATLSAGHVFRGRHKRLEIEVIDVLRNAYGLPLLDREQNWFLSNVFFESTAEWNDPRLGQAVPEKFVEFVRSDPPGSLFRFLMETPENVRIAAVGKFSEGSEVLRGNIEERRQRHAGESVSLRRNIQNVLLTFGEQELILTLAGKARIPDMHPDKILHNDARKVMNETPTYFIEREIALKLEAQDGRPIEENDFRDMQTFCAVVRYADVVVAENNFSNLARQAGLDKKFKTQFTTNLLDLKQQLS